MATFHSARFGTAYCGSSTANVELPTRSWQVNDNAETVTFRNSKTGRFTVAEQTFVQATFSISYDYDYSSNPFLVAGGSVNIVPGTTNAVRLFVGGNATPTNSAFWDMPVAICTSISQQMNMEGKLETTANFMATGTFTEPAT